MLQKTNIQQNKTKCGNPQCIIASVRCKIFEINMQTMVKTLHLKEAYFAKTWEKNFKLVIFFEYALI